jgi:hypothetical protein
MEELNIAKQANTPGGDLSILLSLFIGFLGIIGLLTIVFLDLPPQCGLLFFVFILLSLPGLGRLRQRHRKLRPIVIALSAVLILLPAYIPLGIAIAVHTPTIPAFVKDFYTGPQVVQSVVSPDGNFEAYVVERPSIDPPNQSLFIQRKDSIHFVSIAKLAEDIDSIEKIHWSSQSDIALFQTRCNLIAVHIPGYQTVKIPLGGEWMRTKARKRSTFTGAGPRVAVANIDFPQANSFSYRLEGTETFKTVPMDVF